MSRSEEITSEVRRLVLTCRSMEAQLQQSIPKKTHQEVVGKMQAAIDELTTELERTKAELQRTNHIEADLKNLSDQVTSQTSSITSQLQSSDTQRIKELEEKISSMVNRAELEALQSRYDEMKSSTVRKEDYLSLQNQFSNFVPKETFETMQRSFSETTVPREQLAATEARIQELETRISDSIPRSDHEELIREISTMIGEAPRPSDKSEDPAQQLITAVQ